MKTRLLKDVNKAEYLIRIGTTLYIIGTSVYDIKEDISKLKKEHGLLIIGVVSLIKVCYELYKKVRELREEMKEVPPSVS
jgi:hypothetical protein